MRVFYSFTEEQNKALDDFLENSDMLAALAGDLTISDATAKKLLAELPTDLNPGAPSCGGDRLQTGRQGQLLLGR